jgi:hypothetical protein
MGGYLRLAPTPRIVGDKATDHPRGDLARDLPIADPARAFVLDVVVKIGIDLVDAPLGNRSGQARV